LKDLQKGNCREIEVDFFEILATAVPSKENIHDKMKIRVAASWEVQ
jgi:hypothetical protein